MAPISAKADEFINVLTGGTSGVYYPLGVALSKIYAEKIPGAKTSVQSTKASVENLNLLQAGRGEIAFTLGDSLSDAWKGNAEAGFKASSTSCARIAAIYPNYIQIVALADAGIKTLADLKGKRISVGAPKSGTELNARAILAGAGMSYKDLAKVEYLPFGESVELMKNRQLDVTLQSAGLGVSAMRDWRLGRLRRRRDSEVGGGEDGPALSAGDDPGQHLQGQRQGRARGGRAELSGHRSSLPDEDVYEMTKAIFDNLPALLAAHAAAKAHRPRQGGQEPAGAAAPGRREVLQEKGVL